MARAAARVLRPDRTHFLSIFGSEVFVREWGQLDSPVIFAWHGLGRTSADFAPFASSASSKFRVIAPDLPGRGLSQWLSSPQSYSLESTERAAVEIVRRTVAGSSRDQPVAWLGSSFGGLLGIRLAAGALKHVISKLVVNDIGPALPQAAIDRIVSYSQQVFAQLCARVSCVCARVRTS